LYQASFIQVTLFWTGFINDPERYPHCDWLKTSYCTNKVTFCKYAARLVLDICAHSETWFGGNESIQEFHYIYCLGIFTNQYINTVRICCEKRPLHWESCTVSPRQATSRLMLSNSHMATWSFPVATSPSWPGCAPTVAASPEEKDGFYDQLCRAIRLIWKGDGFALAGDFNACIGSAQVAWSHLVGNMKENDHRLLELCSTFQLCLSNTHFAGSAKFQSHMDAEPYQPHSVPPNWGVPRCHSGPKIQSRHHFSPQRKLRSPKLKYEALEISEVRGPFERKVHYRYFGPLWKQGIYTLQLESKVAHLYIVVAVGLFWKQGRLLYTLQLQRGARGKCLVCLPLNKHTTDNPENDFIWEYETDRTRTASSDMRTFSPDARM